jgi:hypothetical protein
MRDSIHPSPTKAQTAMSDPERQMVDPNDLQPGPIRHDTLPPELLEHIRAVYDVIGPYLGTTLEQFEIGFMRDMHRESEVAVWCSITAAWIAYHEKHLGNEFLPDDEERKLLGALVAISTGLKDAAMLGVPEDVGRRLLECYDGLAEG